MDKFLEVKEIVQKLTLCALWTDMQPSASMQFVL